MTLSCETILDTSVGEKLLDPFWPSSSSCSSLSFSRVVYSPWCLSSFSVCQKQSTEPHGDSLTRNLVSSSRDRDKYSQMDMTVGGFAP